MSGIGTDPEETGGLLDAAREAVTAAEAVVWGERATNADAFEAAIARLVRAVEARTREQVAREIETAFSASEAGFWWDTRDRDAAAHIARNGNEEQQ